MNRSLATLAGAAALAVMTATASAQQQPAAPPTQQNPPVETGALDTTKTMTPAPSPSATVDTGYTSVKSDTGATKADTSKANTSQAKKKKGKWGQTSDTTKPKD
jgi:hypothetical protein